MKFEKVSNMKYTMKKAHVFISDFELRASNF